MRIVKIAFLLMFLASVTDAAEVADRCEGSNWMPKVGALLVAQLRRSSCLNNL